MSMSMSALVSDPIPSPIEVQIAAAALGFDVQIHDPNLPFDGMTGFRPMSFGGTKAFEGGVEMYVEAADKFARAHGIKTDPQFDRVIWFRWSANFKDLYSALVICAALVKRGGKAFADDEGRFKTEGELVAEAQGTLGFIK